METINTHNYEAFFLDFLDGNLSEKEQKELNRFLQNNPSLKEELESFENITLKPEHIVFKNKQNLIKKTQAQHFEITEFEYLCVADIEKDINIEEKQQLAHELKKPENRTAYKQIKNTKLQADKSIIFENKNSLRKNTVILNYRTVISAVSAAAILLFFIFKGEILNVNETDNNLQLAYKHKTIKPIKQNFKTPKTNIYDKNHTQQEQTLVTHNQTIKNSNKHVLAFEDKEPRNSENLYKELIVPIPDIKNGALISNINQTITPVNIRNLYALNTENPGINTKDKFWKYAEKGVDIWKKITKDDNIVLQNDYAENGSVKEVNFIASNFQFRKTYNKK